LMLSRHVGVCAWQPRTGYSITWSRMQDRL
jgi:hypothetical protein